MKPFELEPFRDFVSFGKCVFCLESYIADLLTDEHIIPRSLNGTLVIRKATCACCQKTVNETFEQKTLNTVFLVPRLLLELRRRKREKKKLPAVWPGRTSDKQTVNPPSIQLELDQYPPLMYLMEVEPPGNLLSIDRSGDPSRRIRFWFYNFGSSSATAQGISTRAEYPHGAVAKTYIKVAYCYAVSQLGLEGFDSSEIRDVLRGRRDDLYNFFGGALPNQLLPTRFLHRLEVRRHGEFYTVLVCLFGALNAPVFEVVVGKEIIGKKALTA